MKMEPTVSSETSVIRTQTLGNYPKRNTLQPIGLLKMGPISCLETSVRNYHSMMSNIPEEGRSGPRNNNDDDDNNNNNLRREKRD